MRFDAWTLRRWLVDYCVQGFCSRSLDGRLSALRRFARSRRLSFPPFGSDDWADIKDCVRALLKIDPTSPNRATVVDLHWIMRAAAVLGVGSTADLRTCPLRSLQLLTRALLAHCCMLRGVEHRSGLRVSDVSRESDFFVLAVASRYSEKKLKLRPGRSCIVPIEAASWSAGFVLSIYMERMGLAGDSPLPDVYLFSLIDDQGVVHAGKPATDAQFITAFTAALRSAGMAPEALKSVTNHSFRAGGATDWSVGGLSEALIALQGGWTSLALRVYIRPQGRHALARAAAMLAATRAALHPQERAAAPLRRQLG